MNFTMSKSKTDDLYHEHDFNGKGSWR